MRQLSQLVLLTFLLGSSQAAAGPIIDSTGLTLLQVGAPGFLTDLDRGKLRSRNKGPSSDVETSGSSGGLDSFSSAVIGGQQSGALDGVLSGGVIDGSLDGSFIGSPGGSVGGGGEGGGDGGGDGFRLPPETPGAGSDLPAARVPEPATLLLMGSGIALVFRRRRRALRSAQS